MGYSSGYCIRKVCPLIRSGLVNFGSPIGLIQVSKLVAFVVGAGFIMIQTLQYNGLIDVKYDKVEHQVTVRVILTTRSFGYTFCSPLFVFHPQKALDLNKDGKLDEKDLQVAHDKVR